MEFKSFKTPNGRELMILDIEFPGAVSAYKYLNDLDLGKIKEVITDKYGAIFKINDSIDAKYNNANKKLCIIITL